VREEHIVLHNVGGITGKSILVYRDVVVEDDVSGKGSLVDEGNTIGKDVKKGSFTSTGGTHDVGGNTGCSVTCTVLNDHLASSLLTSGGHFFFVLSDFDLKLDVLPAQLHWNFAELLSIVNQLLDVNRLSSSERLGAGILTVNFSNIGGDTLGCCGFASLLSNH
jgi:hypothetical protein